MPISASVLRSAGFTVGPPYRFVRSQEAEAADAAGAEALAEKLEPDPVPTSATPIAPPVSPFATAHAQQLGPTQTLSGGGKKGLAKDNADLGESLLASGSADMTGTVDATARETAKLERDNSAETKAAAVNGHANADNGHDDGVNGRADAVNGHVDAVEDPKAAKKQLPALCEPDSSLD